VPLARVLMYLNTLFFYTELSPKAVIGPGLVMLHLGCGCAGGTRIGKNCIMVMFVTMGMGGMGAEGDGPPTIGDDVVFLAHTSVWGPVTVGDRTVLGSGVRLQRSVPSDSFVLAPQRQKVLRRPQPGEQTLDEEILLAHGEVPPNPIA
jgi:serine acetyltransferase